MKIIAKTNGGVIIEATENEIANVMGYAYASTNGCPKINIGTDIKISDMYQRLTDIQYNSQRVKDAKDKLKNMLSTLDKVEMTMVEANVMDKKV